MKLLALLFFLLALGACHRGVENNRDAVRQAVIDHLAKRSDLNMTSMNVVVTAVDFRGDQAEATVSFAPKGGDASQGMSMRYTLERQGNRWAVKGRADSAQGAHGQGTLPPAAPSADLPPGHPPVEGDKKKK